MELRIFKQAFGSLIVVILSLQAAIARGDDVVGQWRGQFVQNFDWKSTTESGKRWNKFGCVELASVALKLVLSKKGNFTIMMESPARSRKVWTKVTTGTWTMNGATLSLRTLKSFDKSPAPRSETFRFDRALKMLRSDKNEFATMSFWRD